MKIKNFDDANKLYHLLSDKVSQLETEIAYLKGNMPSGERGLAIFTSMHQIEVQCQSMYKKIKLLEEEKANLQRTCLSEQMRRLQLIADDIFPESLADASQPSKEKDSEGS